MNLDDQYFKYKLNQDPYFLFYIDILIWFQSDPVTKPPVLIMLYYFRAITVIWNQRNINYHNFAKQNWYFYVVLCLIMLLKVVELPIFYNEQTFILLSYRILVWNFATKLMDGLKHQHIINVCIINQLYTKNKSILQICKLSWQVNYILMCFGHMQGHISKVQTQFWKKKVVWKVYS